MQSQLHVALSLGTYVFGKALELDPGGQGDQEYRDA